ncbi:MAG: GTPase HflX [Candidatus Binatia bacterium]|nr:MAG: GTPase HflX [Candidatus Binatia bacterium]
MTRGSKLLLDSRSPRERAILVGTERKDAPDTRPVERSLEELERLCESARVEVTGKVVQSLRRVAPSTYVGRGKVEEIRELARRQGANLAVFDDALTPAQQRNLERALGVRVVDRSQLILDIFARRARTLAGKLQVELAQLQYLLPRLPKQWQHLSRIRGGVGVRGPGETQLEVDRRRVRERIATLRRRLAHVERTRCLHREARSELPLLVLVGYTNSGKSTLMRRLTTAEVLVEDQLFATLDPTARRLRLPDGTTALLTDTVGFIRKLPHSFVDAFRSTLEEVRQADLLLHVVDASNPEADEQIRVVDRVLEEIGAGDRPRLLVLNKMDLVREPVPPVPGPESYRVSALTGEGIPELLEAIASRLSGFRERVAVEFPRSREDLLRELHREGRVLSEEYANGTVRVTAVVPKKVAGRLRKFLRGEGTWQLV